VCCSLQLSGWRRPARSGDHRVDLIDDSEIATQQLRELRSYGIRTALDDFGTGYSSLAYVQRLPLDIIKIDKEFVQSVDEGRSQALANTIVNMARNLGLRTVAEGIETECQALELARLGCEFAQVTSSSSHFRRSR
jgi:EAL domain-containing protein (putative c-di-GMP-specific phosphodiesterase class I)